MLARLWRRLSLGGRFAAVMLGLCALAGAVDGVIAVDLATSQQMDFTGGNGNPGTANCTGAPAIAAAVGFCTNTFSSTTFNTTTVDSALTNGAGFVWGIYNWFSNTQTFSGVTLNGTSAVVGQNNNAFGGTFVSAWKSGATWHGHAFGGGGLFCFTGSFPVPASAPPNLNNGWPSMWSDQLEHVLQTNQWLGQVAGYRNFVEPDTVENFLGFFSGNGNQAQQTIHQWWNTDTGCSGVNCNLFQSQITNISSLSNASHQYCQLWVVATASVSGYVKFYIDGTLEATNSYHKYSYDETVTANASAGATAISVTDASAPSGDIVSGYDVYDVTKSIDLGLYNGTWSGNVLNTQAGIISNVSVNDKITLTPQPPPGTNGATTCTAVWCLGELDNGHLILIIGSNNVQPVTITDVEVWQASTANNLTQLVMVGPKAMASLADLVGDMEHHRHPALGPPLPVVRIHGRAS